MSRRAIGVVVIVLWVAGIAVFATRTMARSGAQRTAEAALRIAPGTYYYAVSQDGRQIGAAYSMLDTTSSGIVSVDYFVGDYPVGPDTLRMTAQGTARYTRGLSLVDVDVIARGDLTPVRMRARMRGDSTLELMSVSPGDSSTVMLGAESEVYTPTMVPVVGMLARSRSAGDTIRMSMFDPLSRTVKIVSLRVMGDSLFRLEDSATLDRATRRWSVVAHDSVRAWRLGGEGHALTIWVDAQGRLVAASEPGGMSLLRGAYETSFVNWRNARTSSPARKPQ